MRVAVAGICVGDEGKVRRRKKSVGPTRTERRVREEGERTDGRIVIVAPALLNIHIDTNVDARVRPSSVKSPLLERAVDGLSDGRSGSGLRETLDDPERVAGLGGNGEGREREVSRAMVETTERNFIVGDGGGAASLRELS